jgi:hypothetical protein
MYIPNLKDEIGSLSLLHVASDLVSELTGHIQGQPAPKKTINMTLRSTERPW